MENIIMGYQSDRLRNQNPVSQDKLPGWCICRYCGTQSRSPDGQFCSTLCRRRWHAEAAALARLNTEPATVDEVIAAMDARLKRK
jgi:hypothetical protein